MASATATTPAGGFLTRLFPPAPPLPDKPDPLADFTYSGPMPGLVAGLYLLARSPSVWVLPGLIWAAGRVVSGGTLLGIFASLVAFAALIAAGWIGWQRPWLFGLAASLVGLVAFGIFRAWLLTYDPAATEYAYPELVLLVMFQESIQPFFGVLAGWYGGYLRRRMAATSGAARRARRRR